MADPYAPEAIQEESLADLIFNAEITDKIQTDVEDDVDEQKATIDELASVLLFPEEIPRGSKREFARNLFKSFRTCQSFMSALGRFPVVSAENEDHSIVFDSAGTGTFRGAIFVLTFVLIIVISSLTSLNIVSTMLNWPSQPLEITVEWDVKHLPDGKINWDSFIGYGGTKFTYPKWVIVNETRIVTKTEHVLRAEELFFFRRNLVALLIILFLMYHISAAEMKLYTSRQFVANYLTFWTESVEIMKIDAGGEAKKFVKKFLIYYICWFVIFCFALFVNIAPVASGAPVTFVCLWIRSFYPPIHAVPDLWITVMRAVGAVVIVYIVLCSKVYVLFFLYTCKILSTACTVWNERLERVFTKEERQKSRKDKCASRTGFDHLFKDYVTLLDLLSGADTLFSSIIESYFSMTLISIVFEVYYLVRPISERQEEFSQARTFDMLILGIYLFNSLFIFYLVSTGAAEVGEAAANGLEIIRRQGIMGHRSDSEMHFMISLYMSYTGHFDTALAGGGYFILDKAFFVALAGTLISYIIIIFQFQPTLGISDREQSNLLQLENIYNKSVLVLHAENTFFYRENREPGT